MDNLSELSHFVEYISDSELRFHNEIDIKAISRTVILINRRFPHINIIHIDFNFELNNQKIHELNFEKCYFHGQLNFQNSTFVRDISFKKCHFNFLNFSNAKFEKKVRMQNCEFHETTNFDNTTFNNLADFYYSTFHQYQQFYLTDFLNITIFSHVTFMQSAQFLYNKVSQETIVSFENAKFNKGLDISRANFFNKINTFNVSINVDNIEGVLHYYEYDTECIPNENDPYLKALKRLRESIRIIKNEFQKSGNRIEAIKYHSTEMNLYRNEINRKPFKSNINDRILLKLNKESNNHGINWIYGIYFTIMLAIFTQILYYISILWIENIPISYNYVPILSYLSNLTEFINITNWTINNFGHENNLSKIVLFLGRIFIAFGYYQTIQAFRKFGKK